MGDGAEVPAPDGETRQAPGVVLADLIEQAFGGIDDHKALTSIHRLSHYCS